MGIGVARLYIKMLNLRNSSDVCKLTSYGEYIIIDHYTIKYKLEHPSGNEISLWRNSCIMLREQK